MPAYWFFRAENEQHRRLCCFLFWRRTMKTVGILGGGQLGMMLAEEIHKLNAKAVCLDPDAKCPASYTCDAVIVSAYDDLSDLQQLGRSSDVITYEFENIPSEQLQYLKGNFNLKQGISPLYDSQNRIREKELARKYGLNPPGFYPVSSLDELKKGIDKLGYPCIYKTATLGYDGHGQVILYEKSDIQRVIPYLKQDGILEEFIEFDFETSIIMIRSEKQWISFPMTVNIHKEGILDVVVAGEKKDIFTRIAKDAKSFMEQAGYYGILTIEFFVKGKQYYFNEMAPRPHNSGHYTLEACTTNQYRELAKYLLDLPLEQPKLLASAIMKNILGKDYENILNVRKASNIHIHMYHKEEVRPYRKMGHITFTKTSLDEYNKNFKSKFCEE